MKIYVPYTTLIIYAIKSMVMKTFLETATSAMSYTLVTPRADRETRQLQRTRRIPIIDQETYISLGQHSAQHFEETPLISSKDTVK